MHFIVLQNRAKEKPLNHFYEVAITLTSKAKMGGEKFQTLLTTMQNFKIKHYTDVYNSLLDSVGEGESGMVW